MKSNRCKIKWPEQKDFTFTIVDDTDNACVSNIKPVYDLLHECGVYTTKTVWVKPSRDSFTGQCLEDNEYLTFVRKLQDQGFEIALHSVGSGSFKRNEILEALELYKNLIGCYPTIHINHSQNKDSIYWGYERYVLPLRWLYQIVFREKKTYYGSNKESDYFWGDTCKQMIQFIRNHSFEGINTLNYDYRMPYRSKQKDKYSNYWFSQSDGSKVDSFNALINKANIDLLEQEHGACLVYTHFAEGFVDGQGRLQPDFEKNIRYLSSKNGWFIPASTLLNYLRNDQTGDGYVNYSYLLRLDILWLYERIRKRLKYGH